MIGRARRSSRRVPTNAYEVASELALIGVTLAVVFTFGRLFADGSYFIPTAAAAVTAHVIAAAVRWVGGGLILSALVSVVGLVITAAVLFPPTTVESTSFLSSEVLSGFIDDLRLATDQFQTVQAPAEVTAPFLLLIAIVMWLVAFLADWAAFRLRAPAEALIPGAAVFIFGSFFAAEQSRILTAVVLVAVAMMFVLFHRLAEAATGGAWLGADAARRGQSALLRAGLGIMVATVVGGVVLAQFLPGYNEPPVIDIEDLDPTEEPRVVLSPLVDIRAGLVNQPDVEVFTVQTPEEEGDYWRITSLDVFDGRIWRSRGSFENASGELSATLPEGTSFEAVTQTFNIEALGEIWLPAAYEPAEILGKPDEVELEYEPESGTLIVDRQRPSSDGLSYTLLSAVPQRDVAAIASASSGVPSEIADRYLDLPDDFSPRVVAQAEEIVAGAESPYQQALALQNFFRDPALFTYDVDVARGHSAERIEDFIFDVRTGYCEQFAGSFAAMARSIGLPSRVAVGFTPGEWDPAIEGFRVTGKHAHAWPEVWIQDVGWLRFEPTPGRGAPGDEAHTGFPADQEGATPQPASSPEAATPQAAPTPAAPDATTIPNAADTAPTTTVAPQSDRAESGVIGGEQGVSASTIISWIVGALVLVALLFTPLFYGRWRARRQRQAVANDPRGQIGLSWSRSLAALRLMGVSTSDGQTPSEVVTQLATTDEGAANTLRPLAQDVVEATYAGLDSIDPERAVAAEQITEDLAARAKAKRGGVEWWWHHASPVSVWRNQVGVWDHLRPEAAEDDSPEREPAEASA